MRELNAILDRIYQWMWNGPLIFLILGVGVYLTVVLRGIQFRCLAYAIYTSFTHKGKGEKGELSPFQALMTSLAGTVGISNIAGVSTAFMLGGIGALFWMWVAAFVGMSLRFGEGVLAMKYRKQHHGEWSGGPMYYLEKGMGSKKFASLFALGGIFSTLGGGIMIQSNSAADALRDHFSIDPSLTGWVLAGLLALLVFGGLKRIAHFASWLVPIMALLYLSGGLGILILHYTEIPHALLAIAKSAFSGQAAAGGFVGATAATALRTGVARAVMTSEMGLGASAIAMATAKTDHPARQGLVGMTAPFFATIIMCSVTGLVLSVTGVMGEVDSRGVLLNGAPLTLHAFDRTIPGGGAVVTIAILLFGFTTLLSWTYYGEKCAEYLFGTRFSLFFRLFFIAAVIPGATWDLILVWKIADVGNGLMAIPNLIAMIALSHDIKQEAQDFFQSDRGELASVCLDH